MLEMAARQPRYTVVMLEDCLAAKVTLDTDALRKAIWQSCINSACAACSTDMTSILMQLVCICLQVAYAWTTALLCSVMGIPRPR